MSKQKKRGNDYRLSDIRNKQPLSPTDIITSRYHMGIGCRAYNPKSIVRTTVGTTMIITGIITTPIPCTTIPLLIGGGAMLGVDIGKHTTYFRYCLRVGFMRYSIKIRGLLK